MLEFYADTHPGCVETLNEDAIGWNTARQVWVVADGMGGHAKGEIASQLVKQTILDEVAREVPLRDAILDAHRAVLEASNDAESSEAMGSTVVALHIDSGACEVVWVGDSRAYLWRRGRLKRLSRDHSFLEMLRTKGLLSEEEARVHPQRHLVTQTLGMGEPQPDQIRADLSKGDWLLLCSDGLTDELDDEELGHVLRQCPTPRDAVGQLIRVALDKGARDNVSVIVVESDQGRAERSIPWWPIALGAAGALVLVLLLELLIR